MGSSGMTANYFEATNCTASKVIFAVCSTLCLVLASSYLHPHCDQEMKMKVAKFEANFGTVQAFGTIYGTQIPIMASSGNSQHYCNYKSFHSLNVQAVGGYRGLFLDVECNVRQVRMMQKCSSILVLTENSQLP